MKGSQAGSHPCATHTSAVWEHGLAKGGFHCRKHTRWPVGKKRSHLSLCMQLCPCLQVPALRAAFPHGDTAPASLPAHRRHEAPMELLWTGLGLSGQTRTAGLHGECSKGEEKGKPYSNKYLKFIADTIVCFQGTESFFFRFPETHI